MKHNLKAANNCYGDIDYLKAVVFIESSIAIGEQTPSLLRSYSTHFLQGLLNKIHPKVPMLSVINSNRFHAQWRKLLGLPEGDRLKDSVFEEQLKFFFG